MQKGQKSLNINELEGIEWGKDTEKGVYANLFSLGAMEKETFLDFALISPSSIINKKAQGVARIVLTYDGLKALYNLIDKCLKEGGV